MIKSSRTAPLANIRSSDIERPTVKRAPRCPRALCYDQVRDASFTTVIVAAPVPSVAKAIAATCMIWGMLFSEICFLEMSVATAQI